mmetsp:Transcript_15602/g.42015  ORF Transcript_15602/g.42015 Transcript_15602/m.42015 type:complete len:415 (-) Transcript_15602:60-1304(-)
MRRRDSAHRKSGALFSSSNLLACCGRIRRRGGREQRELCENLLRFVAHHRGKPEARGRRIEHRARRQRAQKPARKHSPSFVANVHLDRHHSPHFSLASCSRARRELDGKVNFVCAKRRKTERRVVHGACPRSGGGHSGLLDALKKLRCFFALDVTRCCPGEFAHCNHALRLQRQFHAAVERLRRRLECVFGRQHERHGLRSRFDAVVLRRCAFRCVAVATRKDNRRVHCNFLAGVPIPAGKYDRRGHRDGLAFFNNVGATLALALALALVCFALTPGGGVTAVATGRPSHHWRCHVNRLFAAILWVAEHANVLRERAKRARVVVIAHLHARHHHRRIPAYLELPTFETLHRHRRKRWRFHRDTAKHQPHRRQRDHCTDHNPNHRHLRRRPKQLHQLAVLNAIFSLALAHARQRC